MSFKFHRQFYNQCTVLINQETLLTIRNSLPSKKDRTLEQQELFEATEEVAKSMNWDIN